MPKIDPLNHPDADLAARVVLVKWNDAMSADRWIDSSVDIFSDMSCDRALSVGFIAHEDEENIYLQRTVMMLGDGQSHREGILKIPRGMIDKVYKLKDVKMAVRK